MFQRVTFIIITFLLISSCNGIGSESYVDLNCGSNPDQTFEDWQSWTKVNPETLFSEGHVVSWVDVYVDDLAKTTYLTASAPYPECARIVKPIYSDATATDIVKLTIMVKMPPGYDPENGDWWYGVYDASGTYAQMKGGRRQDCISCHKQASDTDYLFSKDVMEAIGE